MGSITINSNVASLNAQRRFGQSTESLRGNFTRIASGLRINSAKDDASGLSVSEQLKADARVFHQGVRNVNDAVSLLNTAEGAARELSSILLRTRELATQSSNGSLSKTQRRSLDEEANALVAEYNRIVRSTQFSGVTLLDTSLASLRVQAGYGDTGSVNFGLGSGLARVAGDGTFQSPLSTAHFPGENMKEIEFGDFNYDGIVDIVGTLPGLYAGSPQVFVQLGNGNGSFQTARTYAAASQTRYIQVQDVNGDSIDDLVTAAPDAGAISVFIGNGNGSFRHRSDYIAPVAIDDFALGDLNGDGVLDVTTFAMFGSNVYVFLGNANGSYQAPLNRGTATNLMGLELADTNQDGKLDIVFTAGNTLGVMLGNGNSTFLAGSTVASVTGALDVKLGDFNNDGRLDAAVGSLTPATGLGVHYGQSNGTFGALQLIGNTRKTVQLEVGDIDGDGQLDIVSSAYDDHVFQITLGNGNGSFRLPTTFGGIFSSEGFEVGDVNGDGALDIIAAQYGSNFAQVLIANTHRGTSTIENLNLATRAGALQSMRVIDTALVRVSSELGAIGAVQSRLLAAANNLQTTRENYVSAAGQITDVDMAEETAGLVRSQILQQAGAAVLSQANQSPLLALTLLSD